MLFKKTFTNSYVQNTRCAKLIETLGDAANLLI